MLKNNPKNIKIEDFSYPLNDDRIAKYPLKNRENSNLLVWKNKSISGIKFNQIKTVIPENSLLFFNNTKVIPARIQMQKSTGAKIEIFCLEPELPKDYALNFQETKSCEWNCIVGNLKRWKNEPLSIKIVHEGTEINFTAIKKQRKENYITIEFSWDKNITFSEILNAIGQTPIPPYLNRSAEQSDKERYQTIYSKFNGSVAAPTAGLHFTEEIINDLKLSGVCTDELTLHVGAGTFKPVKNELIGDHEMHTEHFVIKKENISNLMLGKKNIAVGTTSVRSLESIYWMGVKLLSMPDKETFSISQWEAYSLPVNISLKDSMLAILDYMEKLKLNTINAKTQIMIAPGYKFKVIKGIITNFHQPKSTLLLLISALIGDKWKEVYDFALQNDFRFLSYGDSSILLPND